MSKVKVLKLQPLFRALKLLPVIPLMFVADAGYARVLNPEEIVDIDSTTPVDNYVLNGDSTLNAEGATTRDIMVNYSTLNLNNSSVQATGANGVWVVGGWANITGSNIASDRTGLVVSNDVNGLSSSATVSDSSISGSPTGVKVNGTSELTLVRTTVAGTGATARGLELYAGTVKAIGGSITGNGDAIRIGGSQFSNATLVLSGTTVQSSGGSAILVDTLGQGPIAANISVLDGAQLSSAPDGYLMNVRNGAEANLRVGGSNTHLVGDINADGTSTANVVLEDFATLTGHLENVQSLAVNSNARWVMEGDGSVENLSLNGGGVQFGKPGEFYTLKVENLSGAGGTFYMYNDFTQGLVNTLTVTGTATGNHSIKLDSMGTEPVAVGSTPVVHIASGDASFGLVGGGVSLGAFDYDLVQHAGNQQDWFLDTSSKVISPGTRSVLALFNTAPTVWYGELSTLRSRMGELRTNADKAGGWVRAYGNKFDVSASSGVAYQQVQQGLSFGADAPLPVGDGQWLVGVLGGYSKSDLDLSRGTSGTVNSYYVGAYTTWLDEQSGYYFDGVLKFNRFQNSSDVELTGGDKTKGKYNNYGTGASLEFGRHIKLTDDYFVEPYAQIAGVVIQGKDYDLDNGLSADGSRTHSLLAKAGATAGRNFNLGEGKTVQPYLRAAYVHEFANNNKVEVNNYTFNNDLSGSRGELGAGVAMTMTDKVSLHADFDYSNGDKIEQPWGANVGLRYLW
ncbi:autotransporter outer membrane beta-barrel domain-containing protein [Pseudomonas lundensis]|uniref:autotransporter outer membrane beta-barrel domain-containing protein n=1 Tax=Pseudomonas lundensis TaxID=86185 RepID=UPI00089DC6AC|nr:MULTISPECIES: autotransporter outer membrane beta-barrel domain-containing protein [Pseudomonas]MBS5840532.1 pertactin family autotransporter [Pseudomonas sp.]NMZ99511.1 autotransporter outer membrane beta-barrel domain-containing protein [Pseudomonas lundensis]